MMTRWNRFGLPFLVLVILLLGSAAAAAQENTTYTVVAYDSLDQIGARFDVQPACLAEKNNLAQPGELRVGDRLVIDFSCPRYDGVDFVTNPRDAADGGATSGSDSSGQGGGSTVSGETYVVQRGDTLDGIGQARNVSVVAIQSANNLGGSLIMPGQELIIPNDAPPYGQFPALADPLNPSQSDLGQGGGAASGQTYVVQLGDTLDGIGAQFDMNVECLAEQNNLDQPNRVYPGQELLVPGNCPRYSGFDIVSEPREGA